MSVTRTLKKAAEAVMVTDAASLLAQLADPWLGLAHEVVPVPELGNRKLIVRALTAGDWLDYRLLADELRPVLPEGEDLPQPTPDEKRAQATATNRLLALVVVRSLHTEDRQRAFTDEDAPALVAGFNPVIDRLAAKAFQLSGAMVDGGAVDPVEQAGNA